MRKRPKKGALRRSLPAFVSDKRGSFQNPLSAHWYENAKSIDVYIRVDTPLGAYCASARIRRADLADYIKRTR